jgi:biotin transport system substrate-specific component
MTTLALRFAPPRSRAAARLWYQVILAVVGSLLLAGLARVSIPLPFTPVPITGQTLGVLLIGAAYGPTLGAATVGLYLLEGGVGLPFFAQGAHGWSVLWIASPSGGYLWGFVVAAALTGWLARRGWDRSFGSSVGAMYLGEVVIYLLGLPWLMQAARIDVLTTLEWGLYPFIVGDSLKLLAAAALLPGAWYLMERTRPEED